jgi:hypothetical protein
MSIFLEGTNTGDFTVSDAEGKVLINTRNYLLAVRIANEESSRRNDWVALLDGGGLIVEHGALVFGPGALSHIRTIRERHKRRTVAAAERVTKRVTKRVAAMTAERKRLAETARQRNADSWDAWLFRSSNRKVTKPKWKDEDDV